MPRIPPDRVVVPFPPPQTETARRVNMGALEFAMKQTGLTPSAKNVLKTLAFHADESGEATLAEAELAAMDGLSPETIRRCKRELQQKDKIARRRSREEGQFAVERIKILYGKNGSEDAQAPVPLPSTGQKPHLASGQKPHLASGQKPHLATGQNDRWCNVQTVENEAEIDPSRASVRVKENSQDSNIKNPDFFSKPDGALERQNETAPAEFDAFQAAWRWNGREAPEPARRAFQRLSPAHRSLAIQWVRAFLERHARQKWKLGSAVSYLRDKKWEALSDGSLKGTKEPHVFVFEGSAAHQKWAAYHKSNRENPPYISERQNRKTGRSERGFYRRTLYPPELFSNPSVADEDVAPQALDTNPEEDGGEVEPGALVPISHDIPNADRSPSDETASTTLEPAKTESAIMVANDNRPLVEVLGAKVLACIDAAASRARTVATGRQTLMRPEEIMRRDFELLDLMAARNPPALADRADQFDPSATAIIDLLERDTSSGDEGND